ncbi:plasmid replication initiator TrfA [Piscinibacter gummiphilus]|uniref:Plasmid replication initiator TrfA n=1 Tax=Piscinibacter gummiphilus TaxID=946333 RepID=A0ABZ0D1T7_9BURK|nr:plasmid replication initiator TrfA [Piscinibacter gummiphilus]WOB11215.1 plasmid replication initiator TrfA [Piscinibacter gummiphilus]
MDLIVPPPSSPSEPVNSVQMPLWDERNRGLPVTFAKSALFSVGGKRERRRLDKLPIASEGETAMVYTGEELRTDDEDVLIQLFHLARGSSVDRNEGISVRFSGHQMLRELDWKVSKEGYERLKACLTRMQNGSLHQTWKVKNRKMVYAANIIRKWVLAEGGPKQQQWCVWLEPEIRHLFDPNYALLDWNERMSVSKPIARWLHAFMAPVAKSEVFVAPEEVIRKLSGSTASTMPKFRQSLKEALKEMEHARLIFSWKLWDGYLYVAREPDQDINRATQAAALEYAKQQRAEASNEVTS